ncbi:hypothetical protein WJX72_007938 [[Myrmecia] bisecta]|uniref:Ubiquitin carboxyl-terminal hydrolase n=1 Tax=[Myrmecia] bisecta TaxID=41462 RepID=A0AAW1R7P5_9CHLO
MADDAWTTIESDPGVFSELIQQMGAKGVQVEELWSLDEASLETLRPIYGLIFLFKWQKDDEPAVAVQPEAADHIFFAQQIITNACATQAILSVLLNAPGIDLGRDLEDLKSFSQDFPPDMKGIAIGNCESIRRAHNSFAPPQPIIPDEPSSSKDQDAFHFIAFMPINNVLYELDGLKQGPIKLCDCTEENWLAQVTPLIQARIERYSKSEIRFNLMAVIKQRTLIYQERLEALQLQRERINAKLTGAPSPAAQTASTVEQLPADESALQAELMAIDQQLSGLQQECQNEELKFRKWKDENIRRKHNYIPFLFQFLKLLAEKKQLQLLIEKARQQQQDKATAQQ